MELVVDLGMTMSTGRDGNSIKDNPSAREISQAPVFVQVVYWLTGFAKRVGLHNRKINRIHEVSDSMLSQFEILNLPDQFNEVFSRHGQKPM